MLQWKEIKMQEVQKVLGAVVTLDNHNVRRYY